MTCTVTGDFLWSTSAIFSCASRWHKFTSILGYTIFFGAQYVCFNTFPGHLLCTWSTINLCLQNCTLINCGTGTIQAVSTKPNSDKTKNNHTTSKFLKYFQQNKIKEDELSTIISKKTGHNRTATGWSMISRELLSSTEAEMSAVVLPGVQTKQIARFKDKKKDHLYINMSSEEMDSWLCWLALVHDIII